MLLAAYLASYAVPFLAASILGWRGTRTTDWRRIATLYGCCALLGGALLTLVGVAYRRDTDGLGFLFGFLVATCALSILLLPSAVAVGRRDRSVLPRRRWVPSVLAALLGLGALPFFTLTIGCLLTGECI